MHNPALMRVLSAAILFVAACTDATLPSNGLSDGSSDDIDGLDYVPFDESGKADGTGVQLGGPLQFAAACSPGDHLTVAAVGDVLLHGSLQAQAYRSPAGVASLWAQVGDLLERGDVTYANLEGPSAHGLTAGGREVTDPGPVFDNVVYTGYPRFNYHRLTVDALVASGVDIVSTANNHAMDRGALGVERTLDLLDEVALAHVGTRRRSSEEGFSAFTRANGFTLAWVACSFSTNGVPDRDHQVLGCFTDTDRLEALIRSLAAQPGVDAVLVTPHWGVEYTANPNREQIRLAHRLLDAGATAILGSHPHVLQPWEKYQTLDGRETFIIYSLGNFVSGQSELARRSTLLLYLGLTRGMDGKTRVHGASYVPLHMTTTANGDRLLQATDRATGLDASRRQTTKLFGTGNVQPIDGMPVTEVCP